jgi:hypothetical protein
MRELSENFAALRATNLSLATDVGSAETCEVLRVVVPTVGIYPVIIPILRTRPWPLPLPAVSFVLPNRQVPNDKDETTRSCSSSGARAPASRHLPAGGRNP